MLDLSCLFFYQISMAGWWYTYPSEKYEFVNLGVLFITVLFPILNVWENKQILFPTTNQMV